MTSNQKYLAIISALEKLYVPKLSKAVKFVYSSFISDLRIHGIDTARRNLQELLPPPGLQDLLKGIYEQAGKRGAKLTYQDLQASLKREEKAFGFGRNERWVQAVLAYLRLNVLEFAQSITSTVKEDILKLLEKGIEGELTIEQIAKEIEALIPSRSIARARLIARTEIVRAANVGHAAGARDFPFEVNKKWLAARDERTRPAHRNVHNHVVDENDFFTVPIYKGKTRIGTEQMLYPGDAKASAGNTINCRCRIIHEPKRDSNGNLIRRSTTSATVIPLRSTPASQLPAAGIAAIRKALADAVYIGVKESE